MLAETELPLVEEFGGYIESSGALAAYHLLIGAAAALRDYRCVAKMKGAVRDFRFYTRDEEQPFSFIINQGSLLFYFRLPAVRSGRYNLAQLESHFAEAKENNKGEWTVRIGDIREAALLLNMVFASN